MSNILLTRVQSSLKSLGQILSQQKVMFGIARRRSLQLHLQKDVTSKSPAANLDIFTFAPS